MVRTITTKQRGGRTIGSAQNGLKRHHCFLAAVIGWDAFFIQGYSVIGYVQYKIRRPVRESLVPREVHTERETSPQTSWQVYHSVCTEPKVQSVAFSAIDTGLYLNKATIVKRYYNNFNAVINRLVFGWY